MQAVIEQERVHQPQGALKLARHAAPQRGEREFDLGELSDIALEVRPADAKADDALSADSAFIGDEKPPASGAESILDQVIDTLRWAFGVVWEKIQRVFDHHPSPAEPRHNSSQ